MSQNDLLKVIALDPQSAEYQTVKVDFKKTVPKTVLKIERIQNMNLRRLYEGRKKELENRNGPSVGAGEKILYHGTSEASCSSIMKSNFNRSYAGQNVLISKIQSGQTQERPKPVVIIEPDKNEITVRCKIPGNEDDWTYSWFTDGLSQPFSTGREFRFKIDVSDSTSTITCRGERKGDRQKSEISDAVTLNVSFLTETPKPVLTVQPSQIFRGETVTLTCDIQGEGWGYRWLCGKTKYTTTTELKITAEHRQICKCLGCRWSVCSEWSEAVTLTVFDKPRVTVKPQSSVFTGDTVTLSCDVGQSTGLRIIWYKNSKRIKSGDKTKTLRDVRVSDAGKYGCGVREKNSTTQSHIIMLTVRERPKTVVRVQPDGQTVTLTCDIQETDVTSWSYTWKKDDSEIHESQSQEYRISSVSESHTGNYSCRGREMGGSRYSHTSDEVTLTLSGSEAPLPVLSVLNLISFLLAAFPYLLVSIIIGVKCYRAYAQSDEIDQYAVTEE